MTPAELDAKNDSERNDIMPLWVEPERAERTTMDESTELATQPNSSALTDWNPDEFSGALSAESAKRTALEAYIKSHLKDTVDFGTIKQGGKACLLKPGAEKIASLLKLRPTFRADADTLKMLGATAEGVVAYICILSTAAGEVVAEGRGSAGPEKQDINTRIKIAEKRAMMDAVLRVAALSDHFTQDLEDMEAPRPAAAPAPRPASRPAPRPTSSQGVKTGTVLKFGKFKGTDLGECPTDYLEWMAGSPLDEGDAKYGKKNAEMNRLVRAVLNGRKNGPASSAPSSDEPPPPMEAPGDLNLDDVPY